MAYRWRNMKLTKAELLESIADLFAEASQRA